MRNPLQVRAVRVGARRDVRRGAAAREVVRARPAHAPLVRVRVRVRVSLRVRVSC